MKNLILLTCLLWAISSQAQDIHDSWQKRDSLSALKKMQTDSSEMKIKPTSQTFKSKIIILEDSITINDSKVTELFMMGKSAYKKSHTSGPDKRKNSFHGHWCGFYFGFINFANTSYSMYPKGTPEFMELNWAGSFAMQFNIFQHSINLVPRNNFGLIVGLGMEYQRLRFENKNFTVTTENGQVIPLALEPLGIENVKRSTFKTLYLTIPLLMEVQFPAKYKKQLHVSGGIVGGVRMHSKTKVVYQNRGKQKRKESDNFNMIPFKADVMASIGYRNFNVWGSYTLTSMFKSDKGPKLHPYTIGFGFSF